MRKCVFFFIGLLFALFIAVAADEETMSSKEQIATHSEMESPADLAELRTNEEDWKR